MLNYLATVWRAVTNKGAETPPKIESIAEGIALAAESQNGTRETSRNQGPGIPKFWDATSYPLGDENREPWCAAFVCWCVMMALLWRGVVVKWARPQTARAFGFEEWARANAKHGVLVLKPMAAVKRGDIIVYSFSHVEVAVGDALAGSQFIPCVGGNTNGEGERDGDGVYRKARSRRSVRCIIRIPN